jgi:transcriptional regulator with XRE-family HTH domain
MKTRQDLRKQLGQKLKDQREKLHITQQEVVGAFNLHDPVDIQLSIQSLSKYERGACGIPADTQAKLISVLNSLR